MVEGRTYQILQQIDLSIPSFLLLLMIQMRVIVATWTHYLHLEDLHINAKEVHTVSKALTVLCPNRIQW